MRRKMFAAIFALIVGLAALAPIAGATIETASAVTAPGRLLTFGALDEHSVWVLTDGALLLSDDGGASWREITPSTLTADRLTAAAFLNVQTGWTAHIDESQPGALVMAATTDGGHTWQVSEHRLLLANDPAARISRLSLFWLDATHGWLMLRQATSSNFNHGALFRTQDGGASWRQVDAPGGHPVVFVTPSTGWTAGGPNGDTLFRSDDGGASWRVQPLPYLDDTAPGQRQHLPLRFSADGQQGVVEVATFTSANQRRHYYVTEDGGATWSFVAETAPTVADRWRLDMAANALLRAGDNGRSWQPVLVGAVLPVHPATIERAASAAVAGSPDARTARFEGHGFDMCELGGEEDLRRWIEASPYRAVNLYIGGALRACANNSLDALLLESLSVQGWTFIPTWVGPQAPCTRFRERFDLDPAVSFSQGRAEAEKALQRAKELGLAEADGSGTVLYYNLEAYDGENPACVEAARAFVAGWTQRIREGNSYAGLYALACNPPIARYADLSSPPDAVWFAAWNRTSFDPTMTVWNIPSTCLPPTLWINQQRIRQYTGGHNETWGGVTFEIDSNVLESIVADLSGVVQPPVTVIVEMPALSPVFNEATACEDGWHRFTNVRGHPAYLAVSQPLGATIPPLNYSIWQPTLPITGTYRVEALIPSHDAVEFPCRGVTLGPDTRLARYTIYHHAGATTNERDQLPLNDAWLRLGSYPFTAGKDGLVYLDAAVADHPRLVSFSAMRFTLEFEGLLGNQLYLPIVQR
ncbi:MAG: glycoside hydrolase domain-containing protein [Caldilinea sp.]